MKKPLREGLLQSVNDQETGRGERIRTSGLYVPNGITKPKTVLQGWDGAL